MGTLLGFMTYTKGVEYLIAIGFLLGFVAFWQWSYGKARRHLVAIGVLLYLLVTIGIVAGSCLSSPPQ